MLYFAVFIIVILVIVLVTYMARRMTRAQQLRRLPNHNQPQPQRFGEVAREVTGRFFRTNEPNEPYVPYHRRDLGRTSYVGDMRSTNGPDLASVPPVRRPQERDVEAGDPELPSYYASTTLPAPPPAVYHSSILGRNAAANQSATSIPPPPNDGAEPPKYESMP